MSNIPLDDSSELIGEFVSYTATKMLALAVKIGEESQLNTSLSSICKIALSQPTLGQFFADSDQLARFTASLDKEVYIDICRIWSKASVHFTKEEITAIANIWADSNICWYESWFDVDEVVDALIENKPYLIFFAIEQMDSDILNSMLAH